MNSQSRGFSLLEVLIAVAVLSVVVTVGVVAMNGVSDGARNAKLESDVATLNGAVKSYVASGGDLSGATTPNDVLAKMKTVMTSAQAQTQINPLTGSVIDRRLVAEMQTVAEGATTEPRVHWNAADQNFTISTSSGSAGVKRFILDESLANIANQTESRAGGVMEFASSSGWVWDNANDWDTDSALVPTGVGTTPFPSPPPPASATAGTATAGSATAGSATGGDDGSTPLPRLPTPNFSISGGTYPPEDFPMMVSVTNAGGYGTDGTLKYRINSGPWLVYVGPVAVPEDGTLRARAYSNDTTAWQNSYERSERYYKQLPPRLPTPVLDKPGGAYLTGEFTLDVMVVNAAVYGTNGVLKYQINSGTWFPYGSKIQVDPDQTLRVRAFTSDAEAYRDSNQISEYYYAVAASFSGYTIGEYDKVEGGPNLEYTLADMDSYLSHGSTTIELDGEIIDAGQANTLKFISSNFSGVLPGEEFLVGELLYHNGTTFDNSHATEAELKIEIEFTSPVKTENIKIDLDLVNTENTSDPDESADYVKLANVNEKYKLKIDGSYYDLTLSFGTTDVNGYSSTDQFHVYEGATARGELRGTMTPRQ